ncbi:hypothetical protein MTO96_034185 [Rhipicephalus appendiculatus]
MEGTPSHKSLSDHTSQPVSPQSPQPLQVTAADAVKKEPTAVASAAGTAMSGTPQQVWEILLGLTLPKPAEAADSKDQMASLALDFQFRRKGSEERTHMSLDERLGIELWALCAALSFPLTFSMWLFLGILQHGKVEINANDKGNRTTPSYIAFTETERLIGDPSQVQVALNPQNTQLGSKRLIGRTFDDPKLQDNLKHLPFTVINDNNVPKIKVTCKGEEKVFNQEEKSVMILTKLPEVSEAYFGQRATLACVTVPAYFNDSQRQATNDVTTIAGLQVTSGDKLVLIVDFGGSTFDVSLLSIKSSPTLDVLATMGDMHLGQENFYNRVVDYFIDEFKHKFGTDISSQARAVRRLRIIAEQAKCILLSTMDHKHRD